jgi:serine/threonine protein kinase
VARALAGIHHAGAAHGSLRPSNVLLSPDGPVVTDAGTGWPVIAAGDDGTSLSHSAHPAHPAHPAQPSDDVLALGCVAFYAATGRTPYGEYPASGDVIPRDAGEPDLSGCPADLLPVVRACLQPREARPDATAVSEQLDAAAGTAPPAWLPQAVAARFADYLAIPPPAGRARHRVSWHALRAPWRHGHSHQLPPGRHPRGRVSPGR